MKRAFAILIGVVVIIAGTVIVTHGAPGLVQAQVAADVIVSQHSEFGSILSDADGKTLYLFTNDERMVSNCSGGCAAAWPPLLIEGDPVAGEGLDEGRLTVITRDDGSSQAAFNGWPLYYYRDDPIPGDANGQDRGDVWYVVSPFGGPVQTNALVLLGDHSDLGSILMDRSGRTQYLYTPDERNVSNCAGGCALAWPPLLTSGDPVAGDGLNSDRLGVITRDDGSSQVTYNGWPLYYFFRDEKPGDANGQDSRDIWYVVSPFGGPIQTNALVRLEEHSDLGNILVDRSGRTQYLFTPDESNVSNCSGGCALAWPPLLTNGDPVAGDGVNADRLGVITRDDGSAQVTYNGWPLYYFFIDERPGDANGQDSRDVWYVVSPFGGPVQTNALVMTSVNPDLGTMLVDVSGRSLYLFTRDEPEVSNCSGGCAMAWPPLLTVDAAQGSVGLFVGLLGDISRADGSKQVTYSGSPLYYFANDEKPGDANGQNRGEVWFA
ncbi:MAG: hypothetical protein J4O08_07825, partial [Chloroflexi bacterium]|nr:hypothetical protein [Chloroflexota bacterium]